MINQKLLEQDLINPFVQHMGDAPSKYTRDEVNQREIPSGHQSWLDDADNDPHEVRLNNYQFEKHDAKYYFYKSMSDLMGSNPYMPVVYNINKFQRDDLKRHEFKLERLLGLRDVDVIPLISCLKQVASELQDFDNKITLRLDTELDELLNADAEDYSMFERFLKSTIYSSIVPEFIKSINLELENGGQGSIGHLSEFSYRLKQTIDDFTTTHKDFIGLDIHENNIMFRRVRTGVQLVIADPVIY